MNPLSKVNKALRHLTDLKFINTVLNSLPVEEDKGNKSRTVVGYNYSKVKPEPVENPRILSLSAPALALLDVDADLVRKDPESAKYLCGNKLLQGSEPIAHCYCGYQFGTFSGQLGDGRAHSLGDIRNQNGEIWDLQLKGAGHTPYSRFADGRAVLRSSIREFLCSEAMAGLGIPTTRAASIILSDTRVERDPLYTGNVISEKCAIVMRLSPTFMRFGSFEIFKPLDLYSGRQGPDVGKEKEMLPKMLDYVLEYFYPEVAEFEKTKGLNREETYLEMYKEIVRRSVKLVALWQCYGFCHGVLNTDNMSILGVTIDYGPFGWIDNFDKGHICNHSDKTGRYSYENQPKIFEWNLLKLAEAWKPCVPLEKTTEFVKKNFDELYNESYYNKMREKIGLFWKKMPEDTGLIDELMNVMHECSSDFTNTFRKLSDFKVSSDPLEVNKAVIEEVISYTPQLDDYLAKFKPSFTETQILQLKVLMESNPTYLLMMDFDPEVLEIEEAKHEKFKKVKDITEEGMKQKTREAWLGWFEKYNKRLREDISELPKGENGQKIEMVEESKEVDYNKAPNGLEEANKIRRARMNKVNPKYVLRNYLAEEAIQAAEKDDFSKVEILLQLLLNPFDDKLDAETETKYRKGKPKWAQNLCVSCSS